MGWRETVRTTAREKERGCNTGDVREFKLYSREGVIMKSQVTALSVYGLTDLIAGITPTFDGWTANPTDAADITDNDITTYCTTGNKVAVAWNYCYFVWDLGGFYNILASAMGHVNVTAGTPRLYLMMWDGTAWRHGIDSNASTSHKHLVVSGRCSKIALGLTCSANGTITPDIREVKAWRLE